MSLASTFIIAALALLPSSLAAPLVERTGSVNGTLPTYYTLTAYAPDNAAINGGKLQGSGALLQAQVASYCPLSPQSLCPNGTETAFSGTLYPSSEVPGGQDLYVNTDGQILITVQHSHSIPSGAYWSWQGWTWVPLPLDEDSDCPVANCPTSDARYNCAAPTGYWTFAAPDAAPGVAGVRACPNLYNPNATSAYAVTPLFNRTDCVELVGLATHNYTGPVPPVWSYY